MPLLPTDLSQKVIVVFVNYLIVYFRYLLSIISHISLYVFRSVHPKKETGMVWRLPHLGQVAGMVYTVAASSMSNALKMWPQSSHLNLVIPLSIPDFLAANILFIIIRVKFIKAYIAGNNRRR